MIAVVQVWVALGTKSGEQPCTQSSTIINYLQLKVRKLRFVQNCTRLSLWADYSHVFLLGHLPLFESLDTERKFKEGIGGDMQQRSWTESYWEVMLMDWTYIYLSLSDLLTIQSAFKIKLWLGGKWTAVSHFVSCTLLIIHPLQPLRGFKALYWQHHAIFVFAPDEQET